MPTGYTAIIEDKKDVTFKEYALGCARAFGACITMRDEPSDKKIPYEFKPFSYHTENIKKAEESLKKFKRMSDKEVESQSNIDFKMSLKSINECLKKEREISRRYSSMRKEVESWNPPSCDHIEFKSFMLSQIDMCSKDGGMVEYYENQRKKLHIKSIKEWRDEREKSILGDLSYHSKEHLAEVERCANRTKWINDLRNSLS